MKDKKLPFDRKCHVLYSKPCKKEIRAKISLHYHAVEQETVWEKVQRQYADFLSDWRTDLGGKRNFHNGVGGTYDCIAIGSPQHSRNCKVLLAGARAANMPDNAAHPSNAATSVRRTIRGRISSKPMCLRRSSFKSRQLSITTSCLPN